MYIIKNILYICAAILVVYSNAFAGSGDGVWTQGTVTRNPELINSDYYVQIDGDLFKIMSDISIVQRVRRDSDSYDEKTASIDSLSKNKKILMKVKYESIYQITILD